MPATAAPVHPTLRRVAERHGTARLTLSIDGTAYTCIPIRAAAGHVDGYTLRKQDGQIEYQLKGGECSCPDRRYVGKYAGQQCKHMKACAALGLPVG
jgi:hypothetical protein